MNHDLHLAEPIDQPADWCVDGELPPHVVVALERRARAKPEDHSRPRRRGCLGALAAALAVAVVWWNPFTWFDPIDPPGPPPKPRINTNAITATSYG